MDRANVPTKVEVRSGDLAFIEASKAFHILRRTIDFSQPGIVTGLTLQATAGSTTRVDLLAGSGYAPNGELVELPATLEGQPVGTLNVGEPAIVGLMYREIETKPGAAETDGVARPRRVVRSSAFKVFTAQQWQDLPATFDSDLNADARDRFLICGIVSLPVVATDPLAIVVPPTFLLVKTITQPRNITGLVITEISASTPNSDPFPFVGTADPARIIFEPSTGRAAYAAPFDGVDLLQAAPFNGAGVGAPVVISAGGQFTLVSANGTMGAIVVVDGMLLPSTTVGASIFDDLTVSLLYTQVADRASARDDLHRHMIGGQVPTENNPHGYRFQDIATLVESLIGTLILGTGYTTTLAQAEVPKLVIPANPLVDSATGSLRYQDLIEAAGSSHNFGAALTPMRIRLYRSGADSLCIVLNAKALNQGVNATFVRAAANGDNIDAQSAMIELSPFAVVFYVRDAGSVDTWDFTQWDRVQLFHSFSSNSTALSGSLTLGTGLHTTATARLAERLTSDYSVGAASDIRTQLFQSARTPTPSAGATLRRFRSSVAESAGNNQADVVEDIINADWNPTGGLWTKDDAGVVAKFELGRAFASFYARLTGAAASTFTDNVEVAGWERQVHIDILNQRILAASYRFLTATTFTKGMDGTKGMIPPNHEAYYTWGGSAVTPEPGAEMFNKAAVALSLTRATWPLELPNGAIVTACRVSFFSVVNPGGADYVRAAVVRTEHASSLSESFMTGGTPYDVIANSTIPVVTTLTVNESALTRTVANGTHSYYVWIAATAGAAYTIKAIEIDYTLADVTLP